MPLSFDLISMIECSSDRRGYDADDGDDDDDDYDVDDDDYDDDDDDDGDGGGVCGGVDEANDLEWFILKVILKLSSTSPPSSLSSSSSHQSHHHRPPHHHHRRLRIHPNSSSMRVGHRWLPEGLQQPRIVQTGGRKDLDLHLLAQLERRGLRSSS